MGASPRQGRIVCRIDQPGGPADDCAGGQYEQPHYFIDLRLVNMAGTVIWSGGEPSFLATDDLPMGVFQTIAPHGSYRALLDWRTLYNLAPDIYRLSAVFRVEPEYEPNSAAYYAGKIKMRHAFTGRVTSSAITVLVTADSPGEIGT